MIFIWKLVSFVIFIIDNRNWRQAKRSGLMVAFPQLKCGYMVICTSLRGLLLELLLLRYLLFAMSLFYSWTDNNGNKLQLFVIFLARTLEGQIQRQKSLWTHWKWLPHLVSHALCFVSFFFDVSSYTWKNSNPFLVLNSVFFFRESNILIVFSTCFFLL